MIRKERFPLVIQFKEKYGTWTYIARTDDEFHGAFEDRLASRIKERWFSDEELTELYELEENDERSFKFCELRRDQKYEGFEIIHPTIVNIKIDSIENVPV